MLFTNPFFRGMLATAGVALAVFVCWALYRSYSAYHFVSWDKVRSFINEVTRSLRTDEFQPALILGIGRGGAVLAAMLGAHFPGAVVLTASRPGRKKRSEGKHRRKKEEEEDEMPALEIPPDVVEMIQKRQQKPGVLLVTEAAYSGSTLYEAVGALQDMGFPLIRTLAYGMRPGTSHPPDFFNVVTQRHLRMPWGKLSHSTEK
jgi:hypoxanthine phosphoribosyltransferase